MDKGQLFELSVNGSIFEHLDYWYGELRKFYVPASVGEFEILRLCERQIMFLTFSFAF